MSKDLTEFKDQSNVQAIKSLNTEIVRKFFCADANDMEAQMFVNFCQSEGINPFKNEAHLVRFKAGTSARIITGVSRFVKIAARNPNYNGKESGIILENKSTKEIEYREGAFYRSELETLLGGWCRVFHKERDHADRFTCMIKEREVQTKNDKGEIIPNWFWRKQPASQVRKCAIVGNLREEFPEETGHLLEYAEVDVEHPEMMIADVTPQSNQEMIPDSTTTQTDQELSEQDWTERIPSELVLREEWKAKMAAHFWEQAKPLKLNKEALKKHCADLLGIQHEDFAIVAVVTDPMMLRDLNMAWFTAHNQVLFR